MKFSLALSMLAASKTAVGFTHYLSGANMLTQSCDFDSGLCDSDAYFMVIYTDGTDSCEAIDNSHEHQACIGKDSPWDCSPYIFDYGSEHAKFRTHFYSEELSINRTPGTLVGWAEYDTGETYDMYVHWSGVACKEWYSTGSLSTGSDVTIQWVFGDDGVR